MITVVCATLFLIGSLGLLTTLLLGTHVGHRGPHSHVTHGHHNQHHSGAQQNHSDSQQSHHSDAKHSHDGGKLSLLMTIFSPLVIFSVCLGAGAIGLLGVHFHLPTFEVAVISAIGGIFFYGAIVRPMISTLLRFASTPSKALDGAISEPAEVISRFDSSGRGLVNLTVDGQIIRVLAVLEDADRSTASEISPGDRLVVTNIDTHCNACRVARI